MHHFKSSSSTWVAVAAVLGLAGCSHQQQASQPPTTYVESNPAPEQTGSAMGQPGASGATSGQPQGAGEVSGARPGGSTATGDMGGMQGSTTQYGSSSRASTITKGGSSDVTSLNDGQLAAVIVAIHQGEIQQATLAQSKAKSPDVRKLATQLATSHQTALAKDQMLFSQLQITPTDNAISQQLTSDVQNQMSTLQSLRGRDFDRDFVDQQIKAHNEALELIDRMMPSAKNPQLKANLLALRPKLQDHLQQVQAVQQKLQQGSASSQGSSQSPAGSPDSKNQR
jgi:putative membrane protein